MNEFRGQEKLELNTGLAQLPYYIEEKPEVQRREGTGQGHASQWQTWDFSSGLSDLKSSVLSTSASVTLIE